MRLTRKQVEAVFRLWARQENKPNYVSYRRGVMGTIGCDGAVVVPYGTMFVCVETDGYAHS